MIPKIEFVSVDKKEHVENIAGFLNPAYGWDWSERILLEYPELEKRIGDEKNGENKKKIAIEFFSDFFKLHQDELVEKAKVFQELWNKINDLVMVALEEVIEERWSKNDKIFIAAVGLNPICPRDILGRYFLLFYKMNEYEMKRTVVHEILHFIWFEKWKSIFPDATNEDLDAPTLSWKLSEIVPLAILSDKRIQKIFKHYPIVYDEWQLIKINNTLLLEYIQEFYNNRKDFEDFVKKSWDFVNKYREALK
jgi:hypothetical protein